MISIASSSIETRSSGAGQPTPVTCSFRFSPVPTPRKKRPGIIAAHVAVACATIAGWIRISGHVTPVPRRNRSVTCAMPPMTLQTNGLWPWLSCHGWKWSEIRPNVKPASSASRACCTRSFGRCSSDENAYPSSGMGCDVPRPLLHKLAVRAHRRAMRIVGLGGGGSTPEQVRKLQRYVLGTVSKQRPKERPRICYVPTAVGDAHRVHRPLLRELRRPRRAVAPEVLSVSARRPAGARARAGRARRLGREHGEPARDLARARLRRDRARGVGGGRRAYRRQRRDDLLVRGLGHRLVRGPARGAAGRPRLPRRQRLPALRRRGAAPAA